MKNIIKLLIRLVCMVCLTFMAVHTACAQSDEFATWTGVKLNYKVTSRWNLSGAAEFRSKNHLKEADRVSLNLGAGYNILSFLKLEGLYEVHYRNRGSEGWKFRHRYLAGAQGYLKCHDFKLSLREFFQQTFFEGDVESRLRSRIKIDYAPVSWKVQLYFSVELYQPIGEDVFFSIARMRYRPGVNVKLSSQCSCNVFYCHQYEPKRSANIVGIEFSVSI